MPSTSVSVRTTPVRDSKTYGGFSSLYLSYGMLPPPLETSLDIERETKHKGRGFERRNPTENASIKGELGDICDAQPNLGDVNGGEMVPSDKGGL